MTRHEICEVPGSCEVCDSYPYLKLVLYTYENESYRILPECAKCGEPLNPEYIDTKVLK